MATVILEQNGNDLFLKCGCFSLERTLDCGQAFRFEQRNGIWQGVVFSRMVRLTEKEDGILFFNMDKTEFEDRFYRYFTLDVDYDKMLETAASDPVLKEATDFAFGIRILRQDPWETLCSFIISQNNNIPRIKGIVARLCETFGTEIEPGFFSFPNPERIAGLSPEDLAPIRAGFRVKYILDAAKKVASKEIVLNEIYDMPLQQAREVLMQICGVGPKVAECVLLFAFGRFEAFPLDVWMKRVMAVLYPMGFPECAKGYEGILQQYLFHFARLNKIGVKD